MEQKNVAGNGTPDDDVAGDEGSLDVVLPEPEVDPNPDQAWKALSLVNDWIKHAESKTGIALAATGASGVLLYNLVKDQSAPGPVLSVVAVLAGIAMLVAGLAGTIAVLPRLTVDPGKLPAFNKAVRAEQDLSSLLFFSHIARQYKGDAPTYVEVFRTLTSDDDQLTRQIAQQVHANATVAHRKHLWTNIAVLALSLDYTFLAIVAVIVGRH